MGAESQNVEGGLDVAERNHIELFWVTSAWRKSHLSVRRCESEQHKSWCMSVESFKDHVSTDGSLFGVECVWVSVVQFGHDEEVVPMHGIYGTLDVEFEAERTINRAELEAFLCLFRKVAGLTVVFFLRMKGIGSKSDGRRLVDLDMGRSAQSSPRRHTGGS